MNGSNGGRLDATYPADANAPAAGRRSLGGVSEGLSPETVFRLRVLVSDALSNRVLGQASAGEGGSVRLELARDAGRVRACVSDVGFSTPAEAAAVQLLPLQAGLLETLASHWGTARGDDGSVEIWFELGVRELALQA
jgi:anti-sigma regulatory factor (Ser/Thr protein kinase)